MKKIIVIGIIILFLGMGVQPALADEPKVSTNTIENVENCDCETVVSDEDLNKLLDYFLENEKLDKERLVTKKNDTPKDNPSPGVA